MADKNQDIFASLDDLFGRMSRHALGIPTVGGNYVPQEQPSGNGQIQPAGWVANANATDGTATVTIDSTGITILDGALTIKDSSGNTTASDGVWQNGPGTVVINSSGITITNGALTLSDQFGNNVITGGGFGSSWLDFIDSRVYNAQFGAGSLSGITAATEVGTGATAADYLASLSNDVPYWVIGTRGSDGTLSRVTDSAAPSGKALQWNAAQWGDISRHPCYSGANLPCVALLEVHQFIF